MGKLSLSVARVGDSFPSVSYTINPEIVKRYAEVNGVSQPTSPHLSYVPPGMLAHDIVWIASKYFDITGVLLTGLELKFERPVPDSGTIIVHNGKIDDIFFRESEQHTVVSFVIGNEEGEVFCRARMSCVSRYVKAEA